MGPKLLNLTAYSDSDFYEVVSVVKATDRTAQSLTDWTVHASAVEEITDVSEALAITAAVLSAAGGTISIRIDQADLAALFGATDTDVVKTLSWTLLAKPYGTYSIKLFAGTLTVNRGAGRWG
jgi:hypothetical protein